MSGHGCIFIPRDIHPPNVGIWQTGYITHGPTFEQWRSFVELPRAYSIVCLYIDQTCNQWVMIVSNPALPLPVPGRTTPKLVVDFVQTQNGVRVVNGKSK